MASTTTQSLRNRIRRHARIRARVRGTAGRPRLAVFKSNQNVYAQLIDDDRGHTLTSASSLEKDLSSLRGRDAAQKIGALIAERAKEHGVSKVVFDRGGFQYTGIVHELADAARNAGLSM